MMSHRVIIQAGFCFDFINTEISQFFKGTQLADALFFLNSQFDVTAGFGGCELLYQHLFNAVTFSGRARDNAVLWSTLVSNIAEAVFQRPSSTM